VPTTGLAPAQAPEIAPVAGPGPLPVTVPVPLQAPGLEPAALPRRTWPAPSPAAWRTASAGPERSSADRRGRVRAASASARPAERRESPAHCAYSAQQGLQGPGWPGRWSRWRAAAAHGSPAPICGGTAGSRPCRMQVPSGLRRARSGPPSHRPSMRSCDPRSLHRFAHGGLRRFGQACQRQADPRAD